MRSSCAVDGRWTSEIVLIHKPGRRVRRATQAYEAKLEDLKMHDKMHEMHKFGDKEKFAEGGSKRDKKGKKKKKDKKGTLISESFDPFTVVILQAVADLFIPMTSTVRI